MTRAINATRYNVAKLHRLVLGQLAGGEKAEKPPPSFLKFPLLKTDGTSGASRFAYH